LHDDDIVYAEKTQSKTELQGSGNCGGQPILLRMTVQSVSLTIKSYHEVDNKRQEEGRRCDVVPDIYVIIKVSTQCQTIAAETVQNNNRHWRRPTQVLKHLRVALKHKHKTIKTRIHNVQVTL